MTFYQCISQIKCLQRLQLQSEYCLSSWIKMRTTHWKFIFIGIIFEENFIVNGLSYIGCFWNDNSNATVGTDQLNATSTLDCLEKCFGNGYTYSGTTPQTCYCSNNTNTLIKYYPSFKPMDCSIQCPAVFSTSTNQSLVSAVTQTISVPSAGWIGRTARIAVFNITAFGTGSLGIDFLKSMTCKQNTTLPEPSCLCPCKSVSNRWDFLKDHNMTKDELKVYLQDEVKKLKDDIKIDIKQTSAYMNAKISSPDSRTSSRMMGAVAVVFICVTLGLVVFSDLTRLVTRKKKKNQ